MKTFIAILCILCMLSNTGKTQETKDSIPSEWNFIKQQEKYLRAIVPVSKDTARDNLKATFNRWNWFWSKRFDNNGDMRSYPKLMAEHYAKITGKSGKSTCLDDCSFSCFQADWRFLGPENMPKQTLGKISSFWVNPGNSNIILIGSDAGMWKTVNGGVSWQSITDFCLPGIGISCIAVNPNNNNVIYVATSIGVGVTGEHTYGYGVFKTIDGGVNWQKLNINLSLGPEASISRRIIIHPINNNNIYALLGAYVYKSIDAGLTWTQMLGPGPTENKYAQVLLDMELLPSNTQDEVYVSGSARTLIDASPCTQAIINSVIPGETYLQGSTTGYCSVRPKAKVWKFNSGFNQTTVSNLSDITGSITGYPNDTKWVSLCNSGSMNIACEIDVNAPPARTKIFRKTGTVWNVISDLNIGHNPGVFEVSPSNQNIIYLGNAGLSKSTTGGQSFTSLWPYWGYLTDPTLLGSHADVRCMSIYQPASSGADVLFLGTDGGISKSLNGGTVTSNLNGVNLQLTQFYGLANNEIAPNQLYAGAQDNGIFDNSAQSWRVNVGTFGIGDAYEAVSDKVDPNIAYMTTGNGTGSGKLYKTTNGGATWSDFGCPVANACENRPLYIDKNNNLYVGLDKLYKKTSNGWQVVPVPLATGRSITSIEITDDGDTGYVLFSDIFWNGPPSSFAKRVFKITGLNSATPQESDITPNLTGMLYATPTDLAIEPTLGQKVWVSFGHLWGGNKVYEYDPATLNWTNISQGIPNIPTSTITYLKNSNDLLFVGTDDGVYYRHDGMTQWERFSCNLPRVIVTDLEINYKLNRLRAATYGRGIWETPIPKLFLSTCSVPSTISAKVGTLSYPMTNGQILDITANTATVNVNYAGTCLGGDCCGQTNNAISWTIYQKQISPGTGIETVVQSGNGNNINFNGTFKTVILGSIKRYQYRVEIKHSCSGSDCGTINLQFKGM